MSRVVFNREVQYLLPLHFELYYDFHMSQNTTLICLSISECKNHSSLAGRIKTSEGLELVCRLHCADICFNAIKISNFITVMEKDHVSPLECMLSV